MTFTNVLTAEVQAAAGVEIVIYGVWLLYHLYVARVACKLLENDHVEQESSYIQCYALERCIGPFDVLKALGLGFSKEDNESDETTFSRVIHENTHPQTGRLKISSEAPVQHHYSYPGSPLSRRDSSAW